MVPKSMFSLGRGKNSKEKDFRSTLIEAAVGRSPKAIAVLQDHSTIYIEIVFLYHLSHTPGMLSVYSKLLGQG